MFVFYLDPPYWQMEGYDADFPFEQYQRMAEILSNLKGKAAKWPELI